MHDPDQQNQSQQPQTAPHSKYHDLKYFEERLERGIRPSYIYGGIAGVIAGAAAFAICRATNQSRYGTGVMTALTVLCSSNVMVHYTYQLHRDQVVFERRMEAAMRTEEDRRQRWTNSNT
ncbi:hypothetical protein BASA50_003694 [Batrachochytrium salamandrivorans]|uniref:Cytochrome c oxidase assembly protein COX20, mitochondrial n=1 Tax=Batrachochytrium salamandrivorans TaxID=1357716 RepID=A0ABQ8FJE4_9FUNG|nr:hypothetical protein BASA60_007350 [Batrachochytrium salamandrivorans]KAH6571222.1 hypothetical protein BASA62_003993 [Batrachochytrium salamandrivorans]KAH6591931.1 hypothetical protein BASA61_004753 [Batrachochytrium salamandrivorans]KAH6598659.1 hypothetical protein BASA50_003694 [Batrachochytrium salamandrivorans]